MLREKLFLPFLFSSSRLHFPVFLVLLPKYYELIHSTIPKELQYGFYLYSNMGVNVCTLFYITVLIVDKKTWTFGFKRRHFVSLHYSSRVSGWRTCGWENKGGRTGGRKKTGGKRLLRRLALHLIRRLLI